MLLNAYYWKSEIIQLSEEIECYSEYVEDERIDAPDVPYSLFRLERALLYSAFAARKLFESEKLTDKMRSYNLAVEVIPNILENPDEILPLFRQCPTDDYYDFSKRGQTTIQGRDFTNQLIHSFTALSFDYEGNKAVAFYVASDRMANHQLYYCKLENWQRFLSIIASDEITEISSHYDDEKKKWVTTRK